MEGLLRHGWTSFGSMGDAVPLSWTSTSEMGSLSTVAPYRLRPAYSALVRSAVYAVESCHEHEPVKRAS